ncbi:transcription factor GTE1-like [Typha angustifolia]|uniref:transcription factor GTE1-like n=1 Tax=Typha angustifolia TaxID=59011 RepID=UPI003C3090CF
MEESSVAAVENEPMAAPLLSKPETEVDGFKHRIDGIIFKADELEKKVNEVVQFYESKKQVNNSKGNSVVREKDKLVGIRNTNGGVGHSGGRNNEQMQVDGCRKEVVCSKRMQDLMRQFGTFLRQITNHRRARPFLEPVDVKGLGLDDYYEVIKKPMDFRTIQNRMEAKDDTRYKNVREIYSDVRLVFTNAMKYNKERSDIHVAAKTLLDKFQEKWLQLLPKVVEEETRQKEDEAQELINMQIAQEAAIARLARDTDNELNELNLHLEDIRKVVVQRCRKMSTDEKRKLGVGLSKLSAEDLNKAIEIIAQDNPNFQSTAEVVHLDMDAQSKSTLWRLKFFVKEALELQAKSSASKGDDNSKRKKEICDALAKTAKKRSKKLLS